jgi:hypothetical protein
MGTNCSGEEHCSCRLLRFGPCVPSGFVNCPSGSLRFIGFAVRGSGAGIRADLLADGLALSRYPERLY